MSKSWGGLVVLFAMLSSGLTGPLLFAQQTDFIEVVANQQSSILSVPFLADELHLKEIALHPNAELAFLSIQVADGKQSLYVVRWRENGWSDPEPLFPEAEWDERNPSITPDGNLLLFASKRPLEQGNEPRGDFDIWSLDLTGDTDAEPLHIDGELNSEWDDRSPTMTRRGIIYYIREFHSTAIHDAVFRFSPTNRGRRRNLQVDLPSTLEIESIAISKMDNLMYFSARVPGRDDLDLFVSQHQGTCWKKPVAFLRLNTPQNETSPRLLEAENSLVYLILPLREEVAPANELVEVRSIPTDAIVNSLEDG